LVVCRTCVCFDFGFGFDFGLGFSHDRFALGRGVRGAVNERTFPARVSYTRRAQYTRIKKESEENSSFDPFGL
jgi:hypothetical protein